MDAVSGVGRIVLGSGVCESRKREARSQRNSSVVSIALCSKRVSVLPELFKNILCVLEIIFKMFWMSIKFKPNIIHCHDTPVLPLGLILKALTGAKIIYDAHELESDRNGLSAIGGKLTFFVEQKAWRFIDRLVVVSPSILSWYEQNIGYKKSAVVFNSPLILSKKNNLGKSYLKTKFAIPEEATVFIYNGVFTSGRGLELVSKVFQQQSIRSHIVFLGFGEKEEELIGLSKVYANIHVHDAVAHDEVIAINQSADVGLALVENASLSDFLCLPNKLFEYAFAGVYVLTSNFPEMSAMVKSYNLGECSDVDFQSIYDCVHRIEQDKPFRMLDVRDLSALSWDAQKAKLDELYSELIYELGGMK